MFSTRVMSCAAFAWLAAVSSSTFAQEGKNDPPIIQATGASVPYQSVFSGYRGYQDPELTSWKNANEQVAETSEHAGHDMSSMPGYDMSTMKKEQPQATKPTDREPNKEGNAMDSMREMNHGDQQGMHYMHGKEKQ